MKIFDRVREWASRSDDEKVAMDRRAFLRGMAVTSAGLLVPGATMFGAGKVVRERLVPMFDEYTFIEFSLVKKSVYASANFRVVELPGVGLINPQAITGLDL